MKVELLRAGGGTGGQQMFYANALRSDSSCFGQRMQSMMLEHEITACLEISDKLWYIFQKLLSSLPVRLAISFPILLPLLAQGFLLFAVAASILNYPFLAP